MSAALDPETVRNCAEAVLLVVVPDIPENSAEMQAVSRNQALLAYHALMLKIEPARTFAQSVEDARRLRP